MDQEQRRRKDTGLGPVADMSGRTHGRTLTASSRGLKSTHNVSDVPTTPLHGMFHGPNAPGSSVPTPPISTRVQMPHDQHTPQGYNDTSEQMSSYTSRSGDIQGGQGDDMTFNIGGGMRRRRGIRMRIRRRRVLRMEDVYLYPPQGVQEG
ncbi:hypothetical protein M9H77_36009 [Catharanthus roseus]|uniref:Uncharacterized protein n=1 Tax=Catharanthus roseus TaxID=4058 RepID=A0ACB9ZRK4_CATRO|nr:hypothetical protein M9H77_36009 [Catharanthus roseus]